MFLVNQTQTHKKQQTMHKIIPPLSLPDYSIAPLVTVIPITMNELKYK